MNIIDYALQTERDGEAYYRGLAAKTDDFGVKSVFDLLADAEAEHYQVFMQMRQGQTVSRGTARPIAKIKTLFAAMKEKDGQDAATKDQIDAYTHARDMEKKSQELYEQKAEELTDPEQRELCLRIADEEGKHYLIMDNLIRFLQRPDTWLEDAEWRNMEDY